MENKEGNPYKVHKSTYAYIDIKEYSSNPESGCPVIPELISQIQSFILQKDYPCVGAQAAVNGKTLAFGRFDSMKEMDSIGELAFGIKKYLDAMSERPSSFLTYIAIFPEVRLNGEEDFENSLWNVLNELTEMDAAHHQWDGTASSNPKNPNFSFSFGGKSFFLVGMHPGSSRKARRFPYPAIAFNLQGQFEGLRSKGRFDIMRNSIRERELLFDGSINPMLADFGEGLQAPQYSGRHVDKDWQCPFNQTGKI